MRKTVLAALLVGLLAPLVLADARLAEPFPERPAAYTSTRCVTDLQVQADGSVQVATLGGVLRRDAAGRWSKATRREGLPAHEARGLEGATVRFPLHRALWTGSSWAVQPAADEPRRRPVTWRGRPVDLDALTLPASTGSHVSAVLPQEEWLLVALFGDGVWGWDGSRWTPDVLGLPPEARRVTALARSGATWWVGTADAGVWSREAGRWRRHEPPGEPFDHNGQALASYRGRLFMSTLDDGLQVLDGAGWTRVGGLSSEAPRGMVEFRGTLYVRHGDGSLDRFDGLRWTRGWGRLPRKQASALAADGERLYVAQWGGWSEWDGRSWTHRFDVVRDRAITCLLPDGDRLWVGTQGRGVAEVRRDGTVLWHDERNGLADDWVTCLGPGPVAGTFVAGALRLEGDRWAPVTPPACVTAVTRGFVATRSGVFRDGEPLRPDLLEPEAQALLATERALWVATRTGLFCLSQTDTLSRLPSEGR